MDYRASWRMFENVVRCNRPQIFGNIRGMRISQTEILDELRKFVEANGEVPGERTFSVATGIKTSTWKGVYWVRWTDAVREAGYDPNSLQQRIPDDELLVKLCTFVTELGRFPVKDEFRLHARNTLGFPSWND
jgi:hypothetical protein